MMRFDKFREKAEKSNITLKLEFAHRGPLLLSNEALFHMPLLACIILLLATLRRKPRTAEIGQMVGECIERTLAGFKGSSQHLGWSANLRVRTVSALTFLEISELVSVDENLIVATERGRKLIEQAFNAEDDLSYTLGIVERAYRDICGERRSRLELL